jgi:zinc and cadmium transporter
MSTIWFYSLLSVTIVSLISLIGAFFLVFQVKKLEKILFYMVSFSAGAILGDVFVHLLPELILEFNQVKKSFILILIGIIIFAVFEKCIIWWHHHVPIEDDHSHNSKSQLGATVQISSLSWTILLGDGLHNFIDGMIIAGSFLVSIPTGIATTIAVAFHEIPHEIGNLGVLINAGLNKKRALFLNFLSALPAILGAILVLVVGYKISSFNFYILAFTIGGFIYIACSDLIPELHSKHLKFSQACAQLFIFLLGIGIMGLI